MCILQVDQLCKLENKYHSYSQKVRKKCSRNYRPISLLSIRSKIFERIVKLHLIWFAYLKINLVLIDRTLVLINLYPLFISIMYQISGISVLVLWVILRLKHNGILSTLLNITIVILKRQDLSWLDVNVGVSLRFIWTAYFSTYAEAFVGRIDFYFVIICWWYFSSCGWVWY